MEPEELTEEEKAENRKANDKYWNGVKKYFSEKENKDIIGEISTTKAEVFQAGGQIVVEKTLNVKVTVISGSVNEVPSALTLAQMACGVFLREGQNAVENTYEGKVDIDVVA